ncbi:hypothetical protein KUV86_02115 [Halomonas sp. DP8Y7-3]|uniref:hypothetical protein n=1 Tax=Halomonas sp. DP8Y7-3 TaxID=2859079 RepID=UPI001C94B5E8|nr:hypothetical protein [Halomonas sp. DP8Y7-3]MBY5927904.1 hypothetical protein [Halomonas sp. DP8Y7-3]
MNRITMAPGLTFEETMSGHFSLDSQMPERGERLGHREGTELALHAKIQIDDMNAFLADEHHHGKLGGVVDFAPLGLGLVILEGDFQLFSQGPGAGRQMVYDALLEYGHRRLFLHGVKRVHDDPGPDLWRDTTTLYTTLHEGVSDTADIIGAGVLHLGVAELMAMLGTLTPSGRGDLATVADFGRFFFGELWHLYAPWVIRRESNA